MDVTLRLSGEGSSAEGQGGLCVSPHFMHPSFSPGAGGDHGQDTQRLMAAQWVTEGRHKIFIPCLHHCFDAFHVPLSRFLFLATFDFGFSP